MFTGCCEARTDDVTLGQSGINWRQFVGKRQHGGLYASMSIKVQQPLIYAIVPRRISQMLIPS